MVVSQHTVPYKLELDIIQQVMSFVYPGVERTRQKDLLWEVNQHALKAIQLTGYLNSVIWQNKCLSKESKLQVYVAMVGLAPRELNKRFDK